MCQVLCVQRQQQEGIQEDEERGGGAEGRAGPNLGFAETEQGLLIPEVDFDLPAPKIGLQDLLRGQVRIGADEVSRIAIAEMGPLAEPVGHGADDQ